MLRLLYVSRGGVVLDKNKWWDIFICYTLMGAKEKSIRKIFIISMACEVVRHLWFLSSRPFLNKLFAILRFV